MTLTRPGEFLNEIKNDRIILEDAKKSQTFWVKIK